METSLIKKNIKPNIIIHFGAGSQIEQTKRFKKLQQFMKTLLQFADHMLGAGMSAVDVAEAVVVAIEDSGQANAGKGSYADKNGVVEMDASIMDGKNLKFGGVTNVKTVKNPVKLARKMMDDNGTLLLAGEGAEDFAVRKGLESVSSDYFINNKLDVSQTVGVVVIDSSGNLAVASSTGGIPDKIPGRVGDTPIIGAGIYANNKQCAVACTGRGEDFMTHIVAYDVYAQMEYLQVSLATAVDSTLKKLKPKAGGVVGVDSAGKVYAKHISASMLHGYILEDGDYYVSSI